MGLAMPAPVSQVSVLNEQESGQIKDWQLWELRGVVLMCSLDVLLNLKEVSGNLEGFICGKETFFAVPTMERMARHFQVRQPGNKAHEK